MRVGVKANDNVVTFSYEIENEDHAAITGPNGQVKVLTRAEWLL